MWKRKKQIEERIAIHREKERQKTPSDTSFKNKMF